MSRPDGADFLIFVKDVTNGLAAQYSHIQVGSATEYVSQLKELVLREFNWQGQRKDSITLYFVSAWEEADTEPEVDKEKTALANGPLKSAQSLPKAGIRPGCFLLAKCTTAAVAGAAGGAATARDAEIDSLRAQVQAATAQFEALQLAATWVIPPDVQKKATSVMFVLLNKDGTNSEGCGFFISGNLALTVSHARKACAVDNKIRAKALDGTALSFLIRHDDGDHNPNEDGNFQQGGQNLDFMVLKLQGAPRQHFFPITGLTSPACLLCNKHVSLLACGTGLGEEMRVELTQSLTVAEATISHVGTRHFVYSQSTWDGDSGGCIFFNDKNEVIGLHLEGVNRAREMLDHATGLQEVQELLSSPSSGSKRGRTEDAVRTVSASIRDIISSITTGGLSLFVGCDAVRQAVSAAASNI